MFVFKEVSNESEIKNVARVAKVIWHQHYASILSPGQITYMIENFQSFEAIKNQIAQGCKYVQILVRESDEDKLAGYFAFMEKSDHKDQDVAESDERSIFLSKLYVLKDYRKQGIGKSVIARLKQEARERNARFVWLTVNKRNEESIKAYEKIGFVRYREDVADVGKGYVMDDYCMRLSV